MPEKFRTILHPKSYRDTIQYTDSLLLLGSCFVENIGQKLNTLKYKTLINPLGIVYNPLSIQNNLDLLLNDYKFTIKDLFQHQGLWHSFQHHGIFSQPSEDLALKKINNNLQLARQFIKSSTWIVLTFGTAWVYELAGSKKLVSNCHKLPKNHFKRRCLSIPEITSSLIPQLLSLKQKYPKLKIVFTLSPVRHLKDGLIENQRSKATLTIAIQEIIAKITDASYFPSYEIMMDDLRDYRFYDTDMLHPNSTAIEYIWSLFEQNYLYPAEAALRKSMYKLQKAYKHRALHPNSLAHQNFIKQQLKIIEILEKQCPFLSFQEEKISFEKQLRT